eukprot:TRINITY_DN93896_c0_g1_i1.p1 TRINITY_DN93896_c0_g1~~TRINITY_DN93896_c0_g1_i1.p1  ORF type:complete len:839 (-),score=236.72 TRINITY_DN93896_c0_g1_i1:195-2711(-)
MMHPGAFAGKDPMKDITQDEISKLAKAMKSDEFRNHIDEYTKEISDPANRAEYLEYLAQLESKGEMPEGQQLLRCEPGVCVKTTIVFKNGQTQKCFINIVHSDRLDDLTFAPAKSGEGQQVHLPYSLSPPRPDRDNKDEYCMTTDFAVSTGTFRRAQGNSQLLKMLVDTAADGMTQQFLKGNEEVKKDFKIMQRMACKGGTPMPMSVRGELLKDKGNKPIPKATGRDAMTPSELKEMRAKAKKKTMSGAPDPEEEQEWERKAAKAAAKEEKERRKAEESAPQRIRVPVHRLVHSGIIDMTDYMESSARHGELATTVPKLLKLIVELPTVKKVGDINMEVTSSNVVVEVEDKYYLDLPLPYEIEDSKGSAKFDKTKSILSMELPVAPKLPDPDQLALGRRSFVEDKTEGGDGEISEGGKSDEELPPLEEEEKKQESKEETAPKAPTPSATPTNDAKRERLEFEASDSSLMIAKTPQEKEPEDAPAEIAVEDQTPEEDDADRPNFIQADAFEGAKKGYYFGTGGEGLGYYKDLRQKKRSAAKKTEPEQELLNDQPFVTEIEEEEKPKKIIPSYAQGWFSSTGALGMRVSQSEADVLEESKDEIEVDSRLQRQNLVLKIHCPGSQQDIADVRLVLVGRRLMISFCSRPSLASDSSSSASAESQERWKRHCVRRTLCGSVDPRQWNAEIVSGVSESTSSPSAPSASKKVLQIVLRKSNRGEVWESAFLNAPVQSSISASSSAEPAAAADAGADIALGLGSAPEDPSERSGVAAASAGDQAAEENPPEDSAELDVEAPVVHTAGPVAENKAPLSVDSKATVVQSATVMGQSVLLKNRLMYQLL